MRSDEPPRGAKEERLRHYREILTWERGERDRKRLQERMDRDAARAKTNAESLALGNKVQQRIYVHIERYSDTHMYMHIDLHGYIRLWLYIYSAYIHTHVHRFRTAYLIIYIYIYIYVCPCTYACIQVSDGISHSEGARPAVDAALDPQKRKCGEYEGAYVRALRRKVLG